MVFVANYYIITVHSGFLDLCCMFVYVISICVPFNLDV
jgi:hypothetical protein